MKIIGRIFLFICVTFFLLVVVLPVLILGYFGFIPGLSTLFGSNKPRDLKIRYTEADRASARAKSKVEWLVLPENTAEELSIQRSGVREVKTEFTAEEATALMNNRPWKFFPYSNVQVRFNKDGTGEISGALLKDRVPGYAASIGIPKQAVEFAMKFLPANPVFYLKIKAELTDNKVTVFDPQKFEIGRMPIPINMFLSRLPKMSDDVYAIDIGGMAGELSQIKDKKSLIIAYINGRLEGYSSFFYAKKVKATENKLLFEGRLPEKEMTVR